MVDELTEKLGIFLNYYELFYTIDEATWVPTLTYVSKVNKEKYIFKLQTEEIRDFLDGELPIGVSNMLNILRTEMRNYKIDEING